MQFDNTDDFIPVLNKMKKLRLQKGITQNKIADDLNVSPVYISNIETAKTRLNIRVLVYYALTLNVSVDYLLGTGRLSNDLDQEIIMVLDSFSVEQKQTLLEFLKSMQPENR